MLLFRDFNSIFEIHLSEFMEAVNIKKKPVETTGCLKVFCVKIISKKFM